MKKKIVQVAHVTKIPGPVQTLAEFIEKNENNNLKKIYFELNDGKIWKYVEDFWKTFWKIKKEKRIDLAIGMNCFDSLPLVLLRKDRIKKVIFFGTDFSRQRFRNKLINFIYVMIDRYCALKADFVCCNSQRTIRQRVKEGLSKRKIIYTPNGVFLDKIKLETKKIDSRKLVYIGHVSKEHGLEGLIKVVKKSGLNLDIVGNGPNFRYLKKKYSNSQIRFLGERSHNEVLEYLINFGGFGVAPYTSGVSDWTYYCDPVKIKEYLACLVPVIISDVPEVAKNIEKNGFGFVYKNNKELGMVLEKIKKIDNKTYLEKVKKIKKVRKNFDLNNIYLNIFNKLN